MREMDDTNEQARGPAEAAQLDDASPFPSDLWMVHAIIQPFKLDAVTLALEQLPEFGGMTVLECRGFGRARMDGDRAQPNEGHDRGVADRMGVELSRKLKLEIAVAGHRATASIVEAIVRHAHTGRDGDGKVFAFPLGRAVRVRTYETDDRAL